VLIARFCGEESWRRRTPGERARVVPRREKNARAAALVVLGVGKLVKLVSDRERGLSAPQGSRVAAR
jgi:hypothetical protein